MDKLNVMIVGVGGQGTLLASRILGNAALKMGFDVKVSEVHGMAQRGGSVVTYVKLGKKVYSPIIEKGEADLLLAFEELEALRWSEYLKKDGVFIINTQKIDPMPVIIGIAKYPELITKKFQGKYDTLCAIDALSMAKECGNTRVVNTVLLGVMAKSIGIPKELWLESLKEIVPERLIDVNVKAFEMGYSQISSCQFEV